MRKQEDLELALKRRQRLYNLLKRNGNHYMLQKDIADRLSKFYVYEEREKFHDSQARNLMTKDIQYINNSDEFEKIIMSTPNGIKLSTKREFNTYMRSEYALIFAKLNRARKKSLKGSMDGQMVNGIFTDDVNKVISAFIEE